MQILTVVNNPKEWPFHIPGVQVVDARSYLTKPQFGELRGVKVFNLCRSYRYQSTGYYVTLLASARGHRPLPDISTIQDMKSPSMVRFVSEDLDELIQESLSSIHSEKFTLSVYFGRNAERQYDRLSVNLFNLFQAPMLRAQFARNGRWELRSIRPIPLGEIEAESRDFVVDVATAYFAGRRVSPRRKSATKYDLAILHDPAAPLPPSNEKAIKKFLKIGEQMGLRTELIGRDDYAALSQYDALFIRETTAVNHYTYRFSRRAAAEGMVVIDDPESIVKCSNKVYLSELLSRHEIPMPKGLLVHRDNLDDVERALGFPCVLKQPDSSFSQGVIKVDNRSSLEAEVARLLEKSDLLVAQEFLPTTYDWRVAVLDRQPLFACKYFMVSNHWQIYKDEKNGKFQTGRFETLPVEIAPRSVVRVAHRAANLIGDGFYGVDLKQTHKMVYVMEINDNPNVDAGVEDMVLKDELYRRVMSVFLRRIEQHKAGIRT